MPRKKPKPKPEKPDVYVGDGPLRADRIADRDRRAAKAARDREQVEPNFKKGKT